MTLDEIRRHAKTQPFVPFEIVMVDGRIFRVPHPDFIFVPPVAARTTWIIIAGRHGLESLNTAVISSIRPATGNKRRKAG
jgi:hypothetical protein